VADSLISPDGDYIPQPYKTRLTMDMVLGYASYSSFFGAQGMTQFAFSDVLGDHQISLGTELVISLDRSDYYFTYAYLKNRADYYFAIFHQADTYNYGYGNFYQLRYYGTQGLISYPFNRFNRFDAGLTYNKIEYGLFQQSLITGQYSETARAAAAVTMLTSSYIFDNTIYGYTGPIDGVRHNTTLRISPGLGASKLIYQTIKFDIRKYYMFSRFTSLAGRITLGKSFGPNPQKFILGGLQNWIGGRGETLGHKDNSQFRSQPIDTSNTSMLIDVYLSDFVFPMRGYRFFERTGSNVALMNLEFRFPFLFAFGIPNKFIFSNFGSYLFLDVGAAWDNLNEFDETNNMRQKYGDYSLPDGITPVIAGFGVGVKINLGYFLLRIDTAWDVNPTGYSKPQYYFSIGTDW
jgi:outer membrane protein assembly factor BamA